jgi:ribosomal protein L29
VLAVAKEKKLTVSELYEALYSAKKELFALKLQKATAQLRQTHLIRQKRRESARYLMQVQRLKKA